MIPVEEFKNLIGREIGAGVPRFNGVDLFYHYGKLLRVYPTSIVLETSKGIQILEISHILEVKERR